MIPKTGFQVIDNPIHHTPKHNVIIKLWTIWTERNQQSFEDEGKTVVQLLELCQRTLFDWSQCWGFSDCSTLLDFLSSIKID